MSMPLENDARRVSPGDMEVDHAFVRKAIGWLRNTPQEAALKVLVADLYDYLTTHFAAEEREGGFFETVVSETPQYANAVEALRREHTQMLDEAKRLLAELDDEPRPASDAHLERAKAFAKALQEHERREEGLLQSALERDLLGGN